MGQIFTQSPYSGGSGGNYNPDSGKNSPSGRAVPPPPPRAIEVNIRTMAGDIAMLGQSGGLPSSRPAAPAVVAQPFRPKERYYELGRRGLSPKDYSFRKAVWLVAILVGGGVLFFFGYYFLPLFLPSPDFFNPTAAPISPSVAPPKAPIGVTPLSFNPALVAQHKSFFRLPADEAVVLPIGNPSGVSFADVYNHEVTTRVTQKLATTTLYEVDLKDSQGRPLAWVQFLSHMQVNLTDPAFFDANFEPDYTAFVHRDKLGAWPGYILKSKGGQSLLLLQPSILKIESKVPELTRLFLKNPGTSAGGFVDIQVSGQPVRQLAFNTPGANLAYGWFYNNYWLISTSLDGLKAALQHL